VPISHLEYIYDTSDPPEEIGVIVYGVKDEPLEFYYDQITGSGWPAARLRKAQEWLQAACDKRTPLIDLPADDPDKTTDPNTAWAFWEDGDLVERNIIIERVFVDPIAEQPRAAWKRARDYYY
jgi:hypothetical protein